MQIAESSATEKLIMDLRAFDVSSASLSLSALKVEKSMEICSVFQRQQIHKCSYPLRLMHFPFSTKAKSLKNVETAGYSILSHQHHDSPPQFSSSSSLFFIRLVHNFLMVEHRRRTNTFVLCVCVCVCVLSVFRLSAAVA